MSSALPDLPRQRPALSTRASALLVSLVGHGAHVGVWRPEARGVLERDMTKLTGSKCDRSALLRAGHELSRALLVVLVDPVYARQPMGYRITAKGFSVAQALSDESRAERATVTQVSHRTSHRLSHGESPDVLNSSLLLTPKGEKAAASKREETRVEPRDESRTSHGDLAGLVASLGSMVSELGGLVASVRALVDRLGDRDLRPVDVPPRAENRETSRVETVQSPNASPAEADRRAAVDPEAVSREANRPAMAVESLAVAQAVVLEPVDHETAVLCVRLALDKPAEKVTGTREALGRWLAQGNMTGLERSHAQRAKDPPAPEVDSATASLQATAKRLTEEREARKRAKADQEASSVRRSGAA